MKSFTGEFTSGRGWALLLTLLLGASMMISACGEEEVPAPTTPAPAPPPPPAPEPEPEPPATPTGLQVSASTESSITWTWNAVEGATGYVVQSNTDEMWDDADTVTFNGVPFTTETTYTASDLEPASTVYVRVAAAAGTAEAPLVSNFSTHVTGMTMAPAGPAVPANLRVKERGSDFIEWEWDAVAGAAGYQSQFSGSSSFPTGSAGRAWHQGMADTTRRVSRLDAEADGYLRVRTYTGTQAEPTFGMWSPGHMATTDEPPPPEPLDAPTGLDATERGDDSISLAWDAVDDADHYEVEQRAEDGAWVDTSCDGGDNEVEETVCEATGLDAVTEYDFRVSAVPSSADTQFRASDWATLNNVETTGTRPPPPPMTVPGSEGNLNLIWESDGTSITWRWDQVADRTWKYQVHYMEQPYNSKADPCPDPDLTFAATTDDTTTATTNGWLPADADGFATRHEGDTDLAPGDVALLCVQTVRQAARGQTQYGNLSFAWAATTPVAPSAAPTFKEDSGRTTAMTWAAITFDRGFGYAVRLVSASPVEDGSAGTSSAAAAPSQAVCAEGKPLKNEDSGNRQEFVLGAYDVTGLTDYTSYRLCYRAQNDAGSSEWAISSGGVTLPSQPGSIGGAPSTVDHDDGLQWSFTVPETGHPQETASYNIRLFQEVPEAATADPKTTGRRTLTPKDCDATGAIRNAADDNDIYTAASEVTSGLTRTRTQILVEVPTASVTDAGTGPNKKNYLCVQSKINDTRVSKWRLSGAVTQRKDPEN